MNKLRTIAVGSLVAASLIVSAGPALARDNDWFRFHRDTRWSDRWNHDNYTHNGYTRRDLDYYSRDLERNRYELDKDLRNGAGAREIARDRKAIQTDHDILRQIR